MSKFVFLNSLRELLIPLKRLIDRKAENVNWNENDPSSSGYIANRPFYTGDDILTNVMPETTVTLQQIETGVYGAVLNDSNASPLFEVGATYVTKWNGVEYTSIGQNIEGVSCIGNISIMTGGTPTGEPFLIGIEEGFGYIIYAWDATSVGETRTFSVSNYSENIIKIPEKYLPEISGIGKEGAGKGAEIFNDYEYNIADGEYSHAEGNETEATGDASHAEGFNTCAEGYASHAEGTNNVAYGKHSHVSGFANRAFGEDQFVIGKCNKYDEDGQYVFIIGNGKTYNGSNAHTIDWKGNAWFAGDIKVGGTSQDDTSAETLATINYVDRVKDGIAFKDKVNGYTYIVCMREGNIVSYIAVESIEATTMPTKIEYMAGEYFDPTGMVITATTCDGVTKEITDYTCQSNYINMGDTSVKIYYTDGGITHITTVPITVNPFDAAAVLVDFEYIDNGNDTYTITGWKGTYNGEASTEMIIPNYGCIIV